MVSNTKVNVDGARIVIPSSPAVVARLSHRLKRCGHCQRQRDKSEFHKSVTEKDGLKRTCKECANRYAIEYNKQYAAKKRSMGLERRYGITSEQWDAMFEAQGKVCGICKSSDPQFSRGWHTDHKPGTKIVRGILCFPCNRKLDTYLEFMSNPNVHTYLNATINS
jgi:hypothetical protein